MPKLGQIAVIAEDVCIGCGKCLPACPVDAIVGAPRYMHTVISDECTGCGLCVSPCPVDCIHLVSIPLADKTWRMERAHKTKQRVEAKAQRKTTAYYAQRPEVSVLDRVLEAPKMQVDELKSELLAIMKRKAGK